MKKIKKISYSIISLIMVIAILTTTCLLSIPFQTFAENVGDSEAVVYDYKQDWNNSAIWNRYILNQNAGNFTQNTISSGSYNTVNFFNFVAPTAGKVVIKLDASVTHGNGSTERFYISKATSEVATVPLTTAAVKPSPTSDFDSGKSYKNVVGVFPASRDGVSFTNAIAGTGHIVNGTSTLSVNANVTVTAGQKLVFALFSNKTSYTLNINEFTMSKEDLKSIINNLNNISFKEKYNISKNFLIKEIEKVKKMAKLL